MLQQKISSFHLLLRLMIGVVVVSFAALFVRFAQAQHMPALTIAFWRLNFACVFLLPYSWMTCRAEILSISRKEAGLMTCSGIFLGLHFAAWIASLGYTSVASSAVLVSMGPVFVGLASWLFLREPPSPKTILGLFLAALGCFLIGRTDIGGGHDQILGDVLALAGAVFVAGYLIVGRKLRSRRSLVAYIAPVYGVAMITLLIFLLMAGQPLFGFPPAAYGWALALGLLPQLVGHSTINWALAHLSASLVSIITLAEPIGASLLAWAILREGISWQTASGAVPILAGIYLASRAELSFKNK
jgi:drug/metabolite transporter (DMT)-like permease